MKLLLFGGTFDPPHNGHVHILQNAIKAVQPDKVLVVPANQPPHKQGSETPPALRLAMCACFVPLHPHLEISDAEMRRDGPSYTYQTVRGLRQQYPVLEALYLLIGSDMLCSFTTWKNWRELLQTTTLLVQLRQEEDSAAAKAAANELAGAGGRVLFTGGAVLPMASSDLRAQIAAGQDMRGEIPPAAYRVIEENHLYRPAFSVAQAQKLAKEMLGPKRYIHVRNVADCAEVLARRFGEDVQRASLAAWLHDIVKEQDQAELLRLLDQDAIMAGATARRPFPIWHGPCAAIYAKHTLGIQDKALLDALHCHTTGRVGMSRLDKIVYLADKISAERSFEGIDEVRALAEKDLDAATAAAMRRGIDYTGAKGGQVDGESLLALEDLLARIEG